MKIGSPIIGIMILALLLVPGTTAYPKLEYYITDEVNVLTLQDMYDIEGLCLEVDDATGVEIAVLIVQTTQPDGIEMYAVKTFEESGIGKEGKDNGLLLLISVEESMWRIEVGYGLEGILPDLKVNDIASTYLEPYLAVGDYYSGIYYTVANLGLEIVDNYEGEPPKKDDGPWYPIPWLPLTWWQLLIAIAVSVVIMVLTGGRLFLWIGGSLGGGGRGGFGGGRSGGGGASGKW